MANLGRLAEVWVDNVTTLFGHVMDMGFRSGVATGPRRLTDRSSKQRFGEYGQVRGRYDPFKDTRRSLYGRTDWRGGLGGPRGLFGSILTTYNIAGASAVSRGGLYP